MADEKSDAQQEMQLKVQVPEDMVGGRYANLVMVNHRPNEFTLDFIYTPPTPPFARVVARVILHPEQAKRLAAAINHNVARYEERFGTIPLTDLPPRKIVH